MHLADWVATLAALAGLPYPTDERAAASGLPPLDSANAWPALFGGGGGEGGGYTHALLPLSSDALLDATTGLKLLLGAQHPSGRLGPRYPNASSPSADPNVDGGCGSAGCLFNVSADPEERHDLASEMPEAARSMRARLLALRRGFYDNDDVGVDACPALPAGQHCACWMAKHKYSGVLGPFQEVAPPGGPLVEAA